MEDLLVKDSSVSVHNNNIHTLAIKMYKMANGTSPEIMNDVFKMRDETYYHLRYTTQFLGDPIRSVFNGSESVSYLDPKIWQQIPTEIKNEDSKNLKKEITKWKTFNCPCEICKYFIANLGFI